MQTGAKVVLWQNKHYGKTLDTTNDIGGSELDATQTNFRLSVSMFRGIICGIRWGSKITSIQEKWSFAISLDIRQSRIPTFLKLCSLYIAMERDI